MRVPADAALVVIPMADRGPPAEQAAGETTGETAGETLGPPAPVTPTLGEAMLSSVATNAADPVRRRAVVALLPRLPDRFRLAADAGPRAR